MANRFYDCDILVAQPMICDRDRLGIPIVIDENICPMNNETNEMVIQVERAVVLSRSENVIVEKATRTRSTALRGAP